MIPSRRWATASPWLAAALSFRASFLSSFSIRALVRAERVSGVAKAARACHARFLRVPYHEQPLFHADAHAPMRRVTVRFIAIEYPIVLGCGITDLALLRLSLHQKQNKGSALEMSLGSHHCTQESCLSTVPPVSQSAAAVPHQHVSPHEDLQHWKSSMYMFMSRQFATASVVSRPRPWQMALATTPKRWRNL